MPKKRRLSRGYFSTPKKTTKKRKSLIGSGMKCSGRMKSECTGTCIWVENVESGNRYCINKSSFNKDIHIKLTRK